MERRPLVIALLAALPAQADIAGPGGRVIDCYCTDSRGARVELDREICLVVDGRAFIARCEMSLNNPIWRDTGRSCVGSSLRPLQLFEPAPDPGGIDPDVAASEDKV